MEDAQPARLCADRRDTMLRQNDARPGHDQECDGRDLDVDERRLLALQVEADAAFAAANKARTMALIEQIYDLLDRIEDQPVCALPT